MSDIIAKVAAVEMTDGSSQPDASAGPSGDASEVAAHSGNGIDWDKRVSGYVCIHIVDSTLLMPFSLNRVRRKICVRN